MPGTYSKTVIFTGDSNPNGANYTWVDVNGAETAGWIVRNENLTNNTCTFTIQDWTNNPSGSRSALYRVQHWLYDSANPQASLYDEFTITQYADNSVDATTTTTAEPTTSTTTLPTTTTTEEPTTSTTTLPTTTTTDAPSIYTITYNASGGTGVTNPTQGPLPLTIGNNNFTRSGWTFTGWGTSSGSGGGTLYSPGDAYNIAADDTLYAQWSFDNPTMVWDNTSQSLTYPAGSTVQGIATDSGSGAGHVFAYTAAAASAGPGKLYWASDDTGATAQNAPSWINSVSGGFGTAYGGTNSYDGNVTISYDAYPLSGSGGAGAGALADGETADPMAGTPVGTTRTGYLVAHHPDGGVIDVLTLVQSQETTTTTTTAAPDQFNWKVLGGINGNGSNPGPTAPAHYAGGSTSGDLSTSFQESTAGPSFTLYAQYIDGSGNPITTGLTTSSFTTSQSYASVDTVSYSSSSQLWAIECSFDSQVVSFPTSTTNDQVCHFDTTVDGSSNRFTVIVDSVESCHVEGTVMNLADGSTKLVEELQVGDVLKSYALPGLGLDENENPWDEYSTVANGFNPTEASATVRGIRSSSWGTYINFNEGLTKVTSEHPVLVKDANDNITFKQAMNVQTGDSFFVNGTWVAITSIDIVENTITAYSIDVETQDVYLADGILWHNVGNLVKGF